MAVFDDTASGEVCEEVSCCTVGLALPLTRSFEGGEEVGPGLAPEVVSNCESLSVESTWSDILIMLS